MSTLDAAYKTVHDYQGGSESLGPRVGIGPAVLRNKVNPHNTTHHLTVAEAERLMALTGDHRILFAMGLGLGYLCVKVPDATADGEATLFELMAAAWRTNGDVGAAVSAVMADGRVDRHELAVVGEAINRHQQMLQNMYAQLKAMAIPS